MTSSELPGEAGRLPATQESQDHSLAWRIERPVRWAANAMGVARSVGGVAVATHIAKNRPEERGIAWGVAVAGLGATDFLDGAMVKKLKKSMTEEERELFRSLGHASQGAWIDHMADKAFIYPMMMALTARGEIHPVHIAHKFKRDHDVNGTKQEITDTYAEIEQLSGEPATYPSAIETARGKTVTEIAACAVGASALSAVKLGKDHITDYLFLAPTILSQVSREQYNTILFEAMRRRDLHAARDASLDLLHDVRDEIDELWGVAKREWTPSAGGNKDAIAG